MAAERENVWNGLPKGMEDTTLPCFQEYKATNMGNRYGRKRPEAEVLTSYRGSETRGSGVAEFSIPCCNEEGGDEQPTGNVTPPWPPQWQMGWL